MILQNMCADVTTKSDPEEESRIQKRFTMQIKFRHTSPQEQVRG